MNDKKIYVTKPFLPPIDEYIVYLKRIWDSGILTNNGQLHKELEKELKRYLSCDNITLFVNGHLALETALQILPINSEVITTPYTFASTTHAIVNTGKKPVFCDIKLEDYTIDENRIEELITENTSAILAVHVYGYPCNVNAIDNIAKKYGLKVIYDTAHAFSVEYKGIPISQYGDVSMFSFHATKLFHTIEGGALVYNNNEYKRMFDLYKNFGITGPEDVEIAGINAKMNEFQAAMGLAVMKHINEIIEKRRVITERYYNNLSNVAGIIMIKNKENIKYNYAYLPILVDEKNYGHTRNELFDELEANCIYARKYFYPIITDYHCYKDAYKNCDVTVAEYVSQRIITLPIYADLNLNDVDRICNIVNNFKGK